MNIKYAKEVTEYSEAVLKQRSLTEIEQDEYNEARKTVENQKKKL